MSIYLFQAFLDECREDNIEPIKEGLKEFRKKYKN